MGRVKPFRFDRQWVFPVAPDELWAVLSQTDAFPSWWRWLRDFDCDGFVEHTEARCIIRGPLPYSLSLQLMILEVQAARLIRVAVSGDLRGPARLEVAPHPEGSAARLVWEIQVQSPVLRPMAVWARPLMEWGHDWIVENGVRQFRRRAL